MTCDVRHVTCVRHSFNQPPLPCDPPLQSLNPPLQPKQIKRGKAAPLSKSAQKKIERSHLCRCSLSRCQQTQSLQLILYNVPYSQRFITHCMAQFQVTLTFLNRNTLANAQKHLQSQRDIQAFLAETYFFGQPVPPFEFKNFNFSPIQFTTFKSIPYFRARLLLAFCARVLKILRGRPDGWFCS